MKQLHCFLLLLFCSSAYAADINRQNFNESGGFELSTRDDGLQISWDAPEGRAFMDLQFIPRSGNNAAAPLIREIGINGVPALQGVDPNYLFWVGERDLQLRDGWMIFFDRVPTRPYAVEKGYLVPTSVMVSSDGDRATIEIDGLNSTHFSGSLAFILYHGSPFVHMEARVTQLLAAMDSVPFIFNLGHGIVPETPPENVAHLVALVRREGN